MKTVKKLALMIMAAVCVTALVSCGDNPSQNTSSNSSSNQTQNADKQNDKTDNTSSNSAGSSDVYEQDFNLVNDTGVEIYELYISPSQQNQWGQDVLTVDTLPSGQSVQIKFEPTETSQYWDLMVVDKEGTSITWPNIDLFSVSEVSLKFDGTTPTASFK